MGGSQSILPPRPLGFEYMCIAFREPDKLRVILGTVHEATIIRQTIQESWPAGIQKESFKLNGVHKFQLMLCPFETSSLNEAVVVRQMAERILHRLLQDGWKLQTSSNLTQTTDLTSWIFKKVAGTNVSSQPFLIVGLSSTDSLMVLNAPADLRQLFKDAISESWPLGIQKWSSFKNGVLVIKLRGHPWNPDGFGTVHSRVLLQAIISRLFLKNWNLYGNFNLKSTANTLFFQYDPNMVQGMMGVRGLQPPAHFTISLNSNDLLRVIGAPESLLPVVRDVIQGCWFKGIQDSSRYAGSWQFKLRGTPWWAEGKETVESRFLILKLMEAMHACGWSLVASIDSSRKASDKSSLVFRQSQPKQSPFLCVSLHESDKLRLINAPEDIEKV